MEYGNEFERLWIVNPNGMFDNSRRWHIEEVCNHSQLTARMVITFPQLEWKYHLILVNRTLSIEDRLKIIEHLHTNKLKIDFNLVGERVSDLILIKRMMESEMVRPAELIKNEYLALESIQYLPQFEDFKIGITDKILYKNRNVEVILLREGLAGIR